VADDTWAAILRSTGNVLLNNNRAPSTSALLSGDLIVVQSGAAARIELTGSAVDINPETIVQFEGDELVLEHGSLSVNTSRGLRVRVGCVQITPVHIDWTRYDVSDVDGRVTVSALKDDVYLESRSVNPQQAKGSERSGRVIVREGERKSREEKCGGADLKPNPIADGTGPILNSPYVIGSAVVGIGGLCWILCRGDNPLSPARPDRP